MTEDITNLTDEELLRLLNSADPEQREAIRAAAREAGRTLHPARADLEKALSGRLRRRSRRGIGRVGK